MRLVIWFQSCYSAGFVFLHDKQNGWFCWLRRTVDASIVHNKCITLFLSFSLFPNFTRFEYTKHSTRHLTTFKQTKQENICANLLWNCVFEMCIRCEKTTQAKTRKDELTKNSKHKDSRRNRNPSIMYLHCTLERWKWETKTHRNIYTNICGHAHVCISTLCIFYSRLHVTAHCTFM